MEKFISWSDSEGQNMDLIKQYFDQHPEMLEGKKELLEINQKYSINLIEWRAKHGDFKTAIELLYRDILKEIESKKHDEDYNSFLMQENAPKLLISQFKRQAHLFPNQSKDIDFAVSTMEALQSIIEAELSRLESEKTKENTKIGGSGKSAKNRVLAFNNKTKGSLEDIKIILEDINSLLFENSNEYQWEQLLKGIKLDKPIIINKGITIKDFKYFIYKIFTDYKILKGRIYTDLEGIEAFLWNGDILTAKQIQKVGNLTDPKLKPQIDEILLKL